MCLQGLVAPVHTVVTPVHTVVTHMKLLNSNLITLDCLTTLHMRAQGNYAAVQVTVVPGMCLSMQVML